MKEKLKVIGAILTKKVMIWLGGLLGVSGGLFLLAFILIILLIIGIAGGISSNQDSYDDYEFGYANLSPHVLKYRSLVERYAEEQGVGEHVPVILAIMQQESGGSPSTTDPMQSSESLCGYVGCITDPALSIQQGVKHFKNMLTRANGDLKLAIQSYNFGSGFINYVLNRNGEYEFNMRVGNKETYDLAVQFSQEQYQRQVALGNGHLYSCLRNEAKPLLACYGDILYVWSVMQYIIPQGTGEWLHPVQGHFEVTSPFRPSHRPNHNGVDFGCGRKHLPILATDHGVVVVSEFGVSGQGFGGYGNVIVVKHKNNLYSLYAHLHERNVQKGDTVERGTPLGTCGNTGASRGIHLHLEARTSLMGGHFNPLPLITNEE